jgi:MFS family permease
VRLAVTAVFFLNGAAFASWYARLPPIQDDLDLGPGLVGIALLGAPIGLLCAQPAVGAVIARRGSRPLLVLSPLAFLSVALPALAVDVVTLLLAVVVVGALNGALDIAMNAQGVAVERAIGRRMFTSLHAAFSFGALAGALLAAAAAGAGVDPLPHLLAVAAGSAVVAAALRPRFLRDDADADAAAPRFARPSRRLAALGAVAFCALIAEGAVFDWSAIFLAGPAGASPGTAPLALAAFSLTMGVGRLAGDPLAERLGSRAVATGGLGLAATGLGLALLAAAPAPSAAGFAVMGIGLAAVFPLALRAAGSGPDLAAVSTLGYTGLLAGPPLIGLVAEGVGLRAALGLIVALCAVAALLARRLPE